MPVRFRRLAIVLAVTLILNGCGQITEDTYREAEKFGNGLRDFTTSQISSPSTSLPEESSLPSQTEPEIAPKPPEPVQPETDYYRQHLTSLQQKEYDNFLQAVQGLEKTVQTNQLETEGVAHVLRAVYYDHPELFWLENGGTLYTSGSVGEYHFIYSQQAQIEGMQAEIDAVVQAFEETIPADASEYDKVKQVFEYLVDTVTYSADTTNSGNIYGALVEKKARCEGYTRAAQYLLNRLGIFATITLGRTMDGQMHSWNLIWLEGAFYYMDVTWGDPSFSEGEENAIPGYRNYAYLCATTAEIELSREIDETYAAMPECTEESCSYFVKTGRLLKEVPGEVGSIIADSYRAGEKYVPLRFSSDELYKQAVSDLLEEQEILSILKQEGIQQQQFRYITDDVMRTITLIF